MAAMKISSSYGLDALVERRIGAAMARDGLRQGESTTASRRLRALPIELELSGRAATAQAAWQQYGEALRSRCEKIAR